MKTILRKSVALVLALAVGVLGACSVLALPDDAECSFASMQEMLDFFGGDTQLLLETFRVEDLVALFGMDQVSQTLDIPLDSPLLDDEKIPFVLEPGYDFKDDTVLVTIKKNYSRVGKEFSPADFPGVEIAAMRDLTKLDPDKEHPYLNEANYRQILLLTLANPGKDNVLAAIAQLEKNPIVRHAGVDYINMILPDVEINYGDVGGTWSVTAEDALLLLQHVTGRIRLDGNVLFRAGFSNDLTAADALLVLQIATQKVAAPDNPHRGMTPPDDSEYVAESMAIAD